MFEKEISTILNFIIAIIYLLFGFFVFFKNKKSATNQLFAYICLSLFSWAMGISLYVGAQAETVTFWARLNFAFATFLGTALLLFSLTFPAEKFYFDFKKTFLIFLPNLVMFYLALSPKGLIQNIIYHPERPSEIIFNSIFFFFYTMYFLVYLGIGNAIIFKKYFSSAGILKHQMFYLILGFLPPTIGGLTTNLILISPWINKFGYDLFGPLLPISVPIFLSWAILKHHLMNVRVMATELFAGFISLIFLIQLILSKSFSEFILRFFLFFLVTLFGLFLIRNTLWQINELRRITEIKSEFIAIASHQLRTPLTAIKGYISLLLDGTYGDLDGKINKILKNIYQANERLIGLIKDLLDISRMELGKMQFDFKEISFENLVDDVIEELKIMAQAKNLYLNWEKPQNLPKILGDFDKLHQVVLNIIDNAIKYTEKGGVAVKLKYQKSNTKALLLEVSDTGIGIKKEDIEAIFKGFERGEFVQKIHPEGVGLGLNVARRIVEAHQGKIWVESEGEGRGSTFYIELPIK